MLPDAVPLARGVKFSVAETLWPAAMVLGRENPPSVNSEFVVLADEIVTLDPCADRVNARLLLLPRVTLPKFSAAALVVSPPAETPVPERVIKWEGVPQAFEKTVICPVLVPLAWGLKATVNVMLRPGGKVIGRLNPLRLNPEPLTLAREIVTDELR